MPSETMRDDPLPAPLPPNSATATMGNCSPLDAWMVIRRTKLLSFADKAPGGSSNALMRCTMMDATRAASQQRSSSMASAMRTTLSALASLAWLAARRAGSRFAPSSRRVTHPDS